MTTHGRHDDARGFTLLELLVVITVISIMAGLLIPGIRMAREEARRVQCLSNIRQCIIAAFDYADAHNGRFPPAQYREGGTLYAWDFTTRTSWGGGKKKTDVEPGLLWGSDGAARLQQCPSFTGAANWQEDPFTGYNYNSSYIGHGDGEFNPTPARVSDIRDAANCALFGDGEYEGGANKFMRAPESDIANGGDGWGKSMRKAGTQGFRHRGKTNVGFADGHARSLPDCFDFGEPGEVSPGCGFISPDNSMYDLN